MGTSRQVRPRERVVPIDDVGPCDVCQRRTLVQLRMEKVDGRVFWLCSTHWLDRQREEDFQ